MSHPAALPDLFLDRSLGGIKVPALLRDAGLRLATLSEHYGVPADERVADTEWLELAGRMGWVVFMKDTRIRYNPAERAARQPTHGPLLLPVEPEPQRSRHGLPVPRQPPSHYERVRRAWAVHLRRPPEPNRTPRHSGVVAAISALGRPTSRPCRSRNACEMTMRATPPRVSVHRQRSRRRGWWFPTGCSRRRHEDQPRGLRTTTDSDRCIRAIR